MYREELEEVKVKQLLLSEDYETQDLQVEEDVKIGDVLYITFENKISKISDGTELFGIGIEDIKAGNIGAVLISGTVNINEIDSDNIPSLLGKFRNIGIKLKKAV